MTARRVILEMGAGTDLHGADYTKAAVRGVRDALQHCSLTFLGTLGIDPATMQIDVTVGAQEPEQVDLDAVRAAFPHGAVSVRAVHGGLDVPHEEGGDTTVIASVAVEVRVDLRRGRSRGLCAASRNGSPGPERPDLVRAENRLSS